MALALLTAFALLICVGSVLLSWAQVRRVDGATSGDAGALALALKKVPEGERLDELGRRCPPASWEHRLAREVIAAPTTAAKIAAVNDALAEIEHTFRAGAGWPAGAIRIALFSGMLLGVEAWLAAGSFPGAIGIVCVGAVSAGACFEAQRSAERRVTAQRRAVDDLIAVAIGRLVAEEGPAPPERRSRRRGAR